MSLRLRLLLAVGVISVIALVVADFATYSALRSSLYKQDDQSLAQSTFRVARFVDSGSCPSPGSSFFGPGGGGGGAPPDGTGGGDSFNNIPFVEVRTTDWKVLDGRQCPAHVGTQKSSPQLPSQITGLSTSAEGTQVVYFTAASTRSGGPAFRVQVSNAT